MKLIQLLLAFVGGSAAIYAGLDNGYAVGFVAIVAAYFGTVALTWAGDAWRHAKQRHNRFLRERDTFSGE